MKILHLTIKKKWFDMIVSSQKIEEYREIKPYWDKRLWRKKYDAVCLRNGYAANSPKITLRCRGIVVGNGNLSWGAPTNKEVYIIMLGERIDDEKHNGRQEKSGTCR